MRPELLILLLEPEVLVGGGVDALPYAQPPPTNYPCIRLPHTLALF